MKKILLILLAIILFISFTSALTIQEINSNEKTPILFFESPGCPHCANAKEYLDSVKANYPNAEIIELNINDNVELILTLYDIYGVPTEQRGAVPVIFLGDKYLFGENEIKDNFVSTLENLSETKILDTQENTTKISWLYLIGLAAVDAVNPCELAVLIILMTAILARYPKQKANALKAGLLFSLAILMVYLVFGLLIMFGFKALTGLTSFSGTWFFILLAIIAIILGILNLKDALNYGGGGFIMEVPQKWRPKMKSIIEGTTSPKGAFVVGLIVSFFLTPCTAGPYFVAGGILSTVSLFEALPYLIVYLLIFIAPMIVITLVTYFGFAAVDNMADWRERNLKKIHLIAGILMLIIGVLMILWANGLL